MDDSISSLRSLRYMKWKMIYNLECYFSLVASLKCAFFATIGGLNAFYLLLFLSNPIKRYNTEHRIKNAISKKVFCVDFWNTHIHKSLYDIKLGKTIYIKHLPSLNHFLLFASYDNGMTNSFLAVLQKLIRIFVYLFLYEILRTLNHKWKPMLWKVIDELIFICCINYLSNFDPKLNAHPTGKHWFYITWNKRFNSINSFIIFLNGLLFPNI